MSLPDFEGWAIFAKVAELGSFGRAAVAIGVAPGTVSKAVSRLETQLGSPLFHRTSRRVTLTEIGRRSLDGARRLLAEAETLEADASEESAAPRGLVKVTAPLSFSLAYLGGALAEFLRVHPDITIDLNLSDARVDIIEQGVDLALRIGALEDSSLRARRLCPVALRLVGSPAYFRRWGRPAHPSDLAGHRALVYTNTPNPGVWTFEHAQEGQVRVAVPTVLRANNADILEPLLAEGLGLALQPDFLVWRQIADKQLEAVLPDWSAPASALHLVTPPSPLKPRRVQVLIDFLARRLAAAPWTASEPD
ncbi:MAG TPA: LysR family transcriptional regulator [Caulobacteraceae bacterium]|jgi:DNA-binding transcriptional LysR family regulator|nr:LysR family transcriptional regulator [Caulobacteraceae bacterium]